MIKTLLSNKIVKPVDVNFAGYKRPSDRNGIASI